VPEEEKQLVFHEMFRLLKPGGRVAISDILAKGPLPEDLRKSMALYVGCIAGASQVGMYQKYLKEAGFHGGGIYARHLGDCWLTEVSRYCDTGHGKRSECLSQCSCG
jgi:hypothetical protein